MLDAYPALKALATNDLEAFRELYVIREGGEIYGHMSSAGNQRIAELLESAFFTASAEAMSQGDR